MQKDEYKDIPEKYISCFMIEMRIWFYINKLVLKTGDLNKVSFKIYVMSCHKDKENENVTFLVGSI